MKFLSIVFGLTLIALAPDANAQCRMGSGPDFGDGVPYCSQPPPKTYVEPSGPQWATRWGAIAIDPNAPRGGVGVSSDSKSRRAAEKMAVRLCRSSGGGKTCRIQTSYDNQCGVIAWGDRYYSTANGATVDEAARLALDECAKETSGCRVFYSNCSYPVRIR